MSPGTSSAALISARCPSRSANAFGATRARKSATARSERYSLTKLSPTLNTTMQRMMYASELSLKKIDNTDVQTSRIKNGLFSCRRRTLNPLVWRSVISLRPNSESRRAASLLDRPARELPRSLRTSSTGNRAAALSCSCCANFLSLRTPCERAETALRTPREGTAGASAISRFTRKARAEAPKIETKLEYGQYRAVIYVWCIDTGRARDVRLRRRVDRGLPASRRAADARRDANPNSAYSKIGRSHV